jgi:hypothetical protein
VVPDGATYFRFGGDPVATREAFHAHCKIDQNVIDTIKPGDRRVIYYDSELKGFGLKVTPAGAKRWCVEYRPGARGRGVSKRRMVLGSTSALTPDQARSAARDVLARVALGEDPAALRSGAREMPNFREFAERYLGKAQASDGRQLPDLSS